MDSRKHAAQNEMIFITGGTGFVGSKITEVLARNHQLRLLVRPDSHPHVPVKAETVKGDVTDRESLRGKMDGCPTVVHLVGIIKEHGDTTFDSVIRQGTVNVLHEARAAGAKRFIFMSALGAHRDPNYGYHTAKYEAEEAVKASGIDYTIFRPSVIFGEGDGFVSVLAGVVKSFPITPIAGTGKAKFQPVQVDDVADCFVKAVDDPERTSGQIFELGGAKPYSYDEMIDVIAAKLGKKRPRIHIPLPMMKTVVAISQPLPKALRPPVTGEQLKMLSLDNSTEHSATRELIGREPVALQNGIDYLLKG